MKTWLRSWFRFSVVRKGISGRSRFWGMVSIVMGLRWLLRKLTGKEEPPVLQGEIKPGGRMLITYPEKPSRKRRKAA